MRILVVDDHDALRKSMIDALSRQEDVALVDGAANGAEALKLLIQRRYDVMVTDIVMPVMDGYTLMQEMRRLMPSPTPKVIVATALARDDFVMRAVELGAKFYLVKPFQPDILLGHIRRLASGQEILPIAAADVAPREQSLDERLGSLFLTLGIPAHIKGYQYLRTGVKWRLKTPLWSTASPRNSIPASRRVLIPPPARSSAPSATRLRSHGTAAGWIRSTACWAAAPAPRRTSPPTANLSPCWPTSCVWTLPPDQRYRLRAAFRCDILKPSSYS